jgi:hypothetical protein
VEQRVARPGIRLCAPILAAGLVAAPAPPSAAAEAARSFSADYVVTWLGLPVYETRFAAAIEAGRYRGVMSARSRGLVELVARARIRFETLGRVVAHAFQPEASHQRYLLKHGKIRRIDLRYGPDGTVATKIRPPESPGKRPPVPPALRRHTQDPISALLNGITIPLAAKPCHYAAAVFEGRRRVDTRLSYARATPTPSLPVAKLPRRAIVCLLHAKRLAGFRPRHFRLMPRLPPAQLWVVRYPAAGIWLPVQLRLDTRWGPIYARLVRFGTGAKAKNAAIR